VQPIYLDNAATTPLDPRVMQAMRPFQEGDYYGNPSSSHQFGRKAHAALEEARATVAQAIGAKESEIIFTAGGTEADFLALSGILAAGGKKRLITTEIEHHAVLHTSEWLQELGYEVIRVSPNQQGQLQVADVLAVAKDAGLVSVMWVNNETGVRQPVEQLARELADRGVPLHSDAVQALVTLPIDVRSCPVSSLSFSGHKIFGPKGVGALYLRQGTSFRSPLRGGAQERNRRAGTENLAGIVGFACAMKLLGQEREERARQVLALRTRFIDRVSAQLEDVQFHVTEDGAPHIVSISIIGTLAETVLMNLDLAGVIASGGSACTAGATTPSHVLVAQGLSHEMAKSSMRFSFSARNTEDEVDQAVAQLVAIVQRLRSRLQRA